MDKKLHMTFAIEGEDVDKIDVYAWLNTFPNTVITHGETKIYYTTSKTSP